MKKIVFFIALAASLSAGALQAQDTVWMKPAPLGRYFNNNSWIDTTGRYVASIGCPTTSHVHGIQFYTPDTLPIYGIAAMMTDEFFGHYIPTPAYPTLQSYLDVAYPLDPSYDNCEEELVLYQYDENDPELMLQQGEGLPVHLLYTPVSYYIMSNTPIVSYRDTFPKPVYERYFSAPQIVHDTFYAGVTQYDWEFSKIDSCPHGNLRPPFYLVGIGYPDQRHLDGVLAFFYQDSLQNPGEWRFHRSYSNIDFIFPIIAPPDTTANPSDTTVVNPIDTVINIGDTIIVLPGDTLIIGGDTLVNTGDTVIVTPGEPIIIGGDTIVVNLGDSVIVNPGSHLAIIRQDDLIYRYTSLQPNPATDRVSVLSSFGITAIEAYDLRGRKVYEVRTPNSEFKVTLDVSSWPRGTYLLRILTPAGPTTKKLLIQ